MAKSGGSIEDAVQGMIKETIEGQKEENVEFVQDPEQSRPSTLEEEHIVDLIGHIPPGQGYYFKIYRKWPVSREQGNRPVFLIDIPQPESVNDLEAECQDLAKKYGWPDGLYEIRLFKQGEPGMQGIWQVSLEVPKLQIPVSAMPNSGNGTDPYGALLKSAEYVKQLNETIGGRANGGGIQATEEAFKRGVELGAGRPANEAPNTLGIIEAVIKAAKELAPPRASIGSEVVTALRDAGVTRPSTGDDFVDKLIKFREAGLIPGADSDPTDKLLKVITAIGPLLAGGGGGERTTPIIELIRTLGPQLGGIVTQVTGTINNVVAARSGAIPVSASPSAAIAAPPPGPLPAPPTPNIPEADMMPVFKVILQNAQADNTQFFAELDSILKESLLPAQYEGLVTGSIPLEAFFNQLRPYVGTNYDDPRVRQYFMKFVDSLRAKRAPEQPLEGKCPKCGVVYEYTDRKAFEADPICDDCYCKVEILLPGSASVGVADASPPQS